MSTTNPVISRLQNHRSRIHGMLSPGKKLRQPGESLRASLSPVDSDFGGRKFQLAARKMRSLDSGKLGKTISGGLTSLSTSIHRKYAEIQKLIHFNPGSSRQESIWSSVETPLPETQLSRQETSLEPGVMRPGSIIQKMSTVPQPGQSLESFKDQAQKQPRTEPSLDRKPVMDKKTRRFSQVQEITPGQEKSFPEKPAEPVKKDETQSPVIQSRETSETATIQPQEDPSGSIPDKTVITSRVDTPLPGPSKISRPPEKPAQPLKSDSLPEMPLSVKPRPSQPATRAIQQTPLEDVSQPSDLKVVQPEERQIEELKVLDTQVGQTPQAKFPVREKELLKALPVAKKPPLKAELKKALPVKKEQKQPQKPVTRLAIISTTVAPAAPASPLHPAIQRQSSPVLPPSAPDRPAVQHSLQTTGPEGKKPAPPTLQETVAGRPESPLQQTIDYRQNAPRSLRAIASERMKPADQLPLIHREDKPLITRSKYRTTSIEASRPGLSTKRDPARVQKLDHPLSPPRIPDALPLDKPQPSLVSQAPIPQNLTPIPMPLASSGAAPAPVKQAPKPEAVISPVRSQVAQISSPTPTLARTNNTVQRVWEGHTPPAQNSPDSSGGDNDGSGSTDLQALAENVFPYVKRILEIEANRSSGRLR